MGGEGKEEKMLFSMTQAVAYNQRHGLVKKLRNLAVTLDTFNVDKYLPTTQQNFSFLCFEMRYTSVFVSPLFF